mmetsp:Transcript_11014/g.15429  ORF Transcript_11014/g.15429 Transcript_11014/m.15429 type:complete len:212 (-) Transcript_11014:409-1044(-)
MLYVTTRKRSPPPPPAPFTATSARLGGMGGAESTGSVVITRGGQSNSSVAVLNARHSSRRQWPTSAAVGVYSAVGPSLISTHSSSSSALMPKFFTSSRSRALGSLSSTPSSSSSTFFSTSSTRSSCDMVAGSLAGLSGMMCLYLCEGQACCMHAGVQKILVCLGNFSFMQQTHCRRCPERALLDQSTGEKLLALGQVGLAQTWRSGPLSHL